MSPTTQLLPSFRRELYRSILRLRIVEEQIAKHYAEQEMRCPVHFCIGQEATSISTTSALKSTDYVISGHRSHGHYLGKGGNLNSMMAELYGKKTGCAGGRGGSMHLIDLDVGFLGSVPIVGSTVPIGLGAAFGSKLKGEDKVTMIFLGDAVAETGVFHEALNFAKLHNLPVVFVCENNLYSVYSPMGVRQPNDREITDLAKSHGITSVQADGNDSELVYSITKSAVDSARLGEGPVFLELMTYRWLEHCGPNFDNDLGYRTQEEYEEWREQDPVERYFQQLNQDGVLETKAQKQMEKEITQEVLNAIAFAKSSDFPEISSISNHLYSST